MASSASSGRPEFRTWIDTLPDPDWPKLPLTHITSGLAAGDIVRDGHVLATQCQVFGASRCYLFYGRAGYRLPAEGAIKLEHSCPCCFIFDASLLFTAANMFAFDTGAFANRLFKHHLSEEMQINDFCLDDNSALRANKLIAAAFGSLQSYFDGDLSAIRSPSDIGVPPWEMLATAYLNLAASMGRNEPDDRVASVEASFENNVSLDGFLKGLIVPHSFWSETQKAPWVQALQVKGAIVKTYKFVPGKSPDHYHALLTIELQDMFREWGLPVA